MTREDNPRKSVGRPAPGSSKLIVVRGNSGSGKSAIAAGLRETYGRGIAIVGQDNLRRVVLRDRDVPGAPNIGLIGLTAHYALEHGFHVVLEGILLSDRYTRMLMDLRAEHAGESFFYYLDLPFAETLKRHATKPNAADFGEAEMATWYTPHDLLPGGLETIITQESSLEASILRITEESGLLTDPVPAHADL
jgi:predicted kinase